MENQMKICFCTQAQINILLKRSFPSERIGVNMPTMNLFHGRTNTLFIVGKKEDFIENLEDRLPKEFQFEGQSDIGLNEEKAVQTTCDYTKELAEKIAAHLAKQHPRVIVKRRT